VHIKITYSYGKCGNRPQDFPPIEPGKKPRQPLVCEIFKNCEGLSRVAFMDGNGVVMLGKVVSCERKEGDDKGGKKK